VVSGLVLNFVADVDVALAEMARVTRRGGAIGAYVWDYAGKMDLLRFFWEAAVELDPAAASLDEGVRFPLCHPDALARRFAAAGLSTVEVGAIDIVTRLESFDDYWTRFLGGQGPAPGYVLSLEPSARARLRDRIRTLLPILADGSIELTARAWTVRATVAT
jgi:hypothetical protein